MTDQKKPGAIADQDLDHVEGGATLAAHEIAHIDRSARPAPAKTGRNVVRSVDLSTDEHN